WRRVPESNRCTRICNPENFVDFKGENCKRTCFVQDRFSIGYKPQVNGSSQVLALAKRQRKTAEGAATHLNGIEECFRPNTYGISGQTSTQLAVTS
ncbi:hypothetical protein, partial [Shimia marina]|uniref:hypothetical protein n=1 Tax=Shimia marina TaxID=321267 RepID=UPI001F3E6A17